MQVKKYIITFFSLTLLLSFSLTTSAQYSRHLIQLKDKQASAVKIKDPTSFLSRKAIDRRIRYKIDIDSTDLPVVTAYIDSIRNAGTVKVLSYSKWLNQVLIQTTDATALNKISGFSFVKKDVPVANSVRNNQVYQDKFSIENNVGIQSPNGASSSNANSINYGTSFDQVRIHEGEFLHNAGFTGKGITIAVLDAGFRNYTVLKAFDSLRANNQILGVWDFVANETSVDEDNAHGMYCFSIMAANEPGKYVGTAPKASYFLFRTEEAATEFPIEEHNWVVAAERADSAGADIISSSLGYSLFDDPAFNHSYADMNGDKTIITLGADLAAKKGLIVCNSAGNSGDEAWRYIIAPADGDSVLAIGAIAIDSIPGSFSSYGPTADGRVKPDVASVGVNTRVIATNGTVVEGSGTSFANPNLAGLIACLWQAFPEFSNMEIIDAVKRSAHKFLSPDTRVGYGIPNMRKAYQDLLAKKQEKLLKEEWVKAFPNPFTSNVNVIINAKETGDLLTQLSDMNGRVISRTKQSVQQNITYTIAIAQAGALPRGVYNLVVINGKNKKTIRLVK